MKKYLLPESGSFYKANLHCHTNVSDGKLTPAEVKEEYKKLGYSIVAYTDHDVLIPHDELNDESFLALHGVEMEVNEPNPEGDTSQKKTCHMCFIGIDPENITQPMWHREKFVPKCSQEHRSEVRFDESEPDYERRYGSDGISEMMRIGREKGFFVTYNHPTWSQESYPEYMGYHGMHAFEMFNGACIRDGYDDCNPRVFDDILKGGNRIFCVGADDNHGLKHIGWAFTVLKAPSLSYRDVTQALLDGHFYASEAPEIKELWYEDGRVFIRTSDAYRININYGIRKAATVLSTDCAPVNEAEFEVPENAVYFRLTVIDSHGKRACTNAYFLDELTKS